MPTRRPSPTSEPGRSAPRRCRSSTRPRYDESPGVDQADYINVPLDQMTPFTDGIFDQTLGAPSRKGHTQEIYALLDSVVQAVLTDENADIDALLTEADSADPGADRRRRSTQRPTLGGGRPTAAAAASSLRMTASAPGRHASRRRRADARARRCTWVRGGGLSEPAVPAADAARLRGLLVVADRRSRS